MLRQVNRLNDVISAFFDMLGALLELAFVTPVLLQMCWELAVLVLVCVPLFVIFQYRQGGFIITATENLLKAENKCERMLLGAPPQPPSPPLPSASRPSPSPHACRLIARVDLRYIEENFVFSTTRKLLGLGPAMDKMLSDAQEEVVAKFDVLDIKEAVSSAQLACFNLLMKLGVIGLGVYLMVQRAAVRTRDPPRTLSPGTGKRGSDP